MRALPETAPEAPLPTEFEIFAAGVNDSYNGPCLYDAAAEQAVFMAYREHGVRLIVDLEHDALGCCDRSDARDARAWFDLEAREGALWAVNVEWTEDGQRRLLGRTQRYISPAFLCGTEEEPLRVTRLINVALCSMPATYGITPLVRGTRAKAEVRLHDLGSAASLRRMLSPDLTQAALAAIADQDGAAALKLLNDIVAAAASGDEAAEPAEPADEAPAEPTAPEANAAEPAPEDEKPEEKAQRNALVARLVACGAETPVTAWRTRGTVPCDRLISEPLTELRARVEAVEAGRKPAPKPPTQMDDGVARLSKAELAACKKRGIDPKDYVERKARAVKRIGAK